MIWFCRTRLTSLLFPTLVSRSFSMRASIRICKNLLSSGLQFIARIKTEAKPVNGVSLRLDPPDEESCASGSKEYGPTSPIRQSVPWIESNEGPTCGLSIAVSSLVDAGNIGANFELPDRRRSNIGLSYTTPWPEQGQLDQDEGSHANLTDQHGRSPSLDSRTLKPQTFRLLYRRTRSRRLSFDEPSNPLRDKLEEGMSSSCGLQKRFLPITTLSILLSEKAVAAELLRHKVSPRKLFGILNTTNDEERTRQVQIICGKTASNTCYQKVLAVLLLIDRADRIASFIENNVSDADLPLESVPRKRDPTTFKLRRSRDLQTSLACTKWKNSAVARFEEEQWTVLAPVFQKTERDPVPHLTLRRKQPLPFSTWKPAAKPGACGQVFNTTIQPAHHSFNLAEVSVCLMRFLVGPLISTQVPNGVIAVKQLFPKRKAGFGREEFEKEVEILRRISSENHTNRHLIKLLATYEQNGQFHMLFPYAPRDLETYWELENPNPDKSEELTHWLVNQCQGLAEGLTKIHKYGTQSPNAFMKVDSKMAVEPAQPRRMSGPATTHWFLGRHGDIKPENILWFPSSTYGVLKITDFGIARFTAQNQQAQRERGYPPNSVTYRSPECDDLDGELTGMCDVWALGCVYLVFVTWFTGGYESVKQFARERNAIDEGWHHIMTDSFFTGKNGKARVKDSVVSVSRA